MASKGLSGPILTVHQVPEHFQEHFIIRGYRHPKSTATQCILSVFDATNETLNFWTHFLPSWYFLWVLRGLSGTLDFKNDNYTWPVLAYMFVSVIFPLTSAVAHTFNTMSNRMRHVCFFLDYGALSVFSLGVAIANHAYVFPTSLRHSWYGDNYVTIAAFNSILCVLVSCQTRFMKPSQTRQLLRLSAFAWPYIYDSLPVLYRLSFCDPEDCSLSSQFHHKRQFIFMGLAAFLYASHLPERLNPGRFDIVGHSHQLFHVCTVLGALDLMQAILHDMSERRLQIQDDTCFSKWQDSIGIMVAVMVINTVLILLFSLRLKSFIQQSKRLSKEATT